MFDPLWVPGVLGKENPMHYMVFYGLDSDQGFPDQLDGEFIGENSRDMWTRFRTLGYKQMACLQIETLNGVEVTLADLERIRENRDLVETEGHMHKILSARGILTADWAKLCRVCGRPAALAWSGLGHIQMHALIACHPPLNWTDIEHCRTAGLPFCLNLLNLKKWMN